MGNVCTTTTPCFSFYNKLVKNCFFLQVTKALVSSCFLGALSEEEERTLINKIKELQNTNQVNAVFCMRYSRQRRDDYAFTLCLLHPLQQGLTSSKKLCCQTSQGIMGCSSYENDKAD